MKPDFLAFVSRSALAIPRNTLIFFHSSKFLVSGERLMYLTSQDGDWFLDELSTMSGNIAQLLSVLKNNPLVRKY